MTVVLVVLDGFGIGDDPNRNAIMAASMWNWNRLAGEWPHAQLLASGEAVGLPAGQMGNSEVGHLNLGAGFRVLQDLPRINAAVDDGSFFDNAVLGAACREVAERGSRLHLMGLVGPGGIHAVDEHLVAMVELAARCGLPPDRVLFHAFTDGRDTPPRSAIGFVPALAARFAGRATVATVSGRYWSMDRDKRWERTKRAYDALVHGEGLRAPDATAAVAASYARDEADEFIQPTVLDAWAPIATGDAVIHLNFRADRARQLSRALALADFDEFDRGPIPPQVALVTLTEYQAPDELPVRVAFAQEPVDSLAAHLARLGKRQLHVAETEKYAHVTYFFNGGVEEPFAGEDRILIPSNRDVATYDLAPEMSAGPITDALVAAVEAGQHDFIVANYANPDMVGHTGVWDAAVRALDFVDGCLGRLARATLGTRSPLVITADHGNVEAMRDAEGNPQTKHTTSPVPVVLISENHMGARLRDGALSDVAPTLCELLGIPPGPEMTGASLLARTDSSRD
ncbi:MAG TPA: 2,3-bisphosphoglycerate-independent phosphoglycerate mutase [Candidatus Limnocylindria bacterium]|nr:2,3-bisphosphoglycerate-independent phosphoglycerate mutase [Candidatus Limnocylindria bacterium]